MQTLAENAIKHGIANIKSGGELLIKSFIQDGYHVIELLNDGVYDSRKNTNGVGIQNTKQRLSILYNDMATFDICGVDQNKVKVTIKIPI
jgi:LytS/YehU family sensor histidine kinase